MASAPTPERDALSRITGAFRRLQDKRAAGVNAEAAPTQGAQPPPAAKPPASTAQRR